MNTLIQQIRTDFDKPIKKITGKTTNLDYKIEASDLSRGDFSINVAFLLSQELKKHPTVIAEEIVAELSQKPEYLERVEAQAGFINLWLKKDVLVESLTQKEEKTLKKKFMIEYAHPNTHKEMHIGHMRTLITGEAIARILEGSGAKVFRANYQGDIGPHVAKCLYGVQLLLEEENLTLEQVGLWGNTEKAHFLGRGYVLGNQNYEKDQAQIDKINMQLYAIVNNNMQSDENSQADKSENEKTDEGDQTVSIEELYRLTRQWSLDYYQDFYTRFYTSFDKLFFESEMVEPGKRIVMDNVGKVFTADNDGSIIFAGEKYGLHTRVFITKAGNPTYEGKEMGNAMAELAAFPFDLKVHIVASEQTGYFQVVFKALDLIAPEKFVGKQKHIPMGMVNLIGRKMSSRTGDVLTVDSVLDQVREKVMELVTSGRIEAENIEKIVEQIVIGAVKYSVLKVGTTQDVAFDIEKSVSLEGDSGPYLQYTFARTQSILAKSMIAKMKAEMSDEELTEEEMLLLRTLYRFEQVKIEAAERLSPTYVAEYLYDLAKAFNLFYQKVPILKAELKLVSQRLYLTQMAGNTLKDGLSLLGIHAPEKM